MAGTIFTATGTKLFIAPSVAAEPANAAAYAGLTWTEIAMIETVGEYGDESSIINFAVLGDGRQRKAKGARDAGTLPITTAHIADDAGQLALIAAEATYNNYPFKIVLPNRLNAAGTDEINYFIGLVTSKRLNVGGNDNVVRKTFNVAVNSKITEVAPTAV
jgi:hypothetical protein